MEEVSFRRSFPLSRKRTAADQRHQCIRIGRFDQVHVESGRGGALAIGILPPPGERGNQDARGRRQRAHVHCTPTSSAWLNLVERWFRDVTATRIRRGSFQSVPELIAVIDDYLAQSNQNPHIFVWTALVDSILAKIAKCKEAFDALH